MDFHVDLSGTIRDSKNTGIALCTSNKKYHVGGCLSSQLKKALKNHNEFCGKTYAIYAFCIWILIKDNTNHIDKLVICNDEPFLKVKEQLLKLSNNSIKEDNISSIFDFRESIGKKINSPADNPANKYRRYALNKVKSQKYQLNAIPLNLSVFLELTKINR